MRQTLKILILEDRIDDAEILLDQLRRDGFDPVWNRVDSKDGYLTSLDPTLDVILADFALPHIDARLALDLLKQRGLDIPFIVVSGTIDEDVAVDCMKRGAADCLLKDRLARLGVSVRQALEQKRLRERNRQVEEGIRLQARSLEVAAIGIAITRRDATIVWVNPAFCRMTGYSKEEVIGQNPRMLKSGKHALAYYQALWNQILAGKVWHGQICNRRKDGSLYTEEMTITPFWSSGGEITHFIAIKQDITERKRAEEIRHQLASNIRLLLDSTLEGIFGTNLQGECILVNKSAAGMLGYEAEELQGRNMHSQIHYRYPSGAPYPAQECPILRTARTGQVCRVDTESFIRRDGTSLLVDYSSYPIIEGGFIKGAVVVFEDITLRRDLEAHLRQAQKLEAVGQFAGGIAHDFNNLLTIVEGHASLILEEHEVPAEARDSAEQILQASQRASSLTSKLLTFSRKQTIQPAVLNLNQVVQDTARMLSRVLHEDTALQCNCDPELPPIYADAVTLDQILINLTVNAQDAMPGGGALRIATSRRHIDAEHVLRHPEALFGEFVCLSVSDTGCGIPGDQLPRLFEPFFTTKPAGKGTGLGLSTVYGIVKQQHGWIEVSSEVGSGTTFDIYFPTYSDENGLLSDRC